MVRGSYITLAFYSNVLLRWIDKESNIFEFLSITLWSKNKNNQISEIQIFLTEFSTSSLCACEQCGAQDWKRCNFWRDRIASNFSKNAFPENWLQILKIVQSVKLRRKNAPFLDTYLLAICWERAVALAFHLCCLFFCFFFVCFLVPS